MAETPRFTTKVAVRRISGVSATLVSDDDVDDILFDIEFQVERFLNANFTPVEDITVKDGNSKSTIFVQHAPLLAVRSLTTNDVSIDIDDIIFKKSGLVRLKSTADKAVFIFLRDSVIIEYLHGRVEWDKQTSTTTTAATTAGASVSLTVSSITGFSDNDWVEIFGTDGNREVAQIGGSPAGSTIVLDRLSQTHNSGSLVRLVKIPQQIKRLVDIFCGIGLVARVVGESFDDITGYTIENFQVQKGEPFTQWRETAVQLIKQKDEILKKIRPTPGIVS